MYTQTCASVCVFGVGVSLMGQEESSLSFLAQNSEEILSNQHKAGRLLWRQMHLLVIFQLKVKAPQTKGVTLCGQDESSPSSGLGYITAKRDSLCFIPLLSPSLLLLPLHSWYDGFPSPVLICRCTCYHCDSPGRWVQTKYFCRKYVTGLIGLRPALMIKDRGYGLRLWSGSALTFRLTKFGKVRFWCNSLGGGRKHFNIILTPKLLIYYDFYKHKHEFISVLLWYKFVDYRISQIRNKKSNRRITMAENKRGEGTLTNRSETVRQDI